MMTENQKYLESNWKILNYALEYWRILIGVAIVAAILAAVFSSPKFITPKFTSSAVIYPANLGQYGSETPLEQMLQYLQSSSVRDSIIRKFDLHAEYKIDPEGDKSKHYMLGAYYEHVSIEETAHEAVKINVKSKDPAKAKEMVEGIIHQVNLKIRNTEKEKYLEIVYIAEELLDKRKARMDSLEKLTKKMSLEYGIVDLPTQSERITEGYISFLKSGKKGEDFKDAKKMYDNLVEHGRTYHDLNIQLTDAVVKYNKTLEEYQLAMKDYNKMQTYTNVIVEPQVADKKSSPVRWLIVVFSVAGAVTFTFFLLLLLGYKNR